MTCHTSCSESQIWWYHGMHPWSQHLTMDLAGKLAPRVSREFSGVPNRDPLLDHVTVRNNESYDVTTDVSLCRQRDRHSKHPRNDVDRLNPIRPTHCGRDAYARTGSSVRGTSVPADPRTRKSKCELSLVFAWPSRIRKPGGDMATVVNAPSPLPEGRNSVGGRKTPKLACF